MRRLVVETPIRMATAARHVATFALYVVMISVLLLRFDIVDIKGGLAALVSGWALALLAVMMSVIAFATIWRTGAAGGARAFFAFALACALLTPAAYYGLKALESPSSATSRPISTTRRASPSPEPSVRETPIQSSMTAPTWRRS